MERKESLVHKLTKERSYRAFNRVEKGCILGIVLTLGFFALTYSYYVNQVVPSLPRTLSDPYTTLWNGQANGNFGKIGGNAVQIFGRCAVNTNCNLALTSPNAGQFIFVELLELSTGNCNGASQTVTDTQGNTYSNQIGGSYDCKQNSNHSTMTEWSTTLATSAADTVTAKDTVSDFAYDIYQFHATTGSLLSLVSFTHFVTTGAVQTETINVPAVPAFGIIMDMFSAESTNGGCSALTFSQVGGSTLSNIADTGNCIAEVGYSTSFNFDPVQRGSTKGYLNVTTNFTIPNLSSIATLHVILELQSFPICPTSYSCGDGSHAFFNSDPTTGQTIQLSPNATFPGVAISTSAVDLSNSASKALAMSVFSVLPVAGSYATSEQTAWYLTVNGTLPNQAQYNPLNDTSVVLIVYQFVTTPGVNSNYYVYLQRQVGQSLTIGSTNPGTSNCNFGGTLFLCGGFSIPNNQNSNIQSLVLNFTGAANNSGGTNNQAGQSYFCGGSINFGTHTCNLGGYAQTAISFLAQVVNQTLLPWLSIQNSYHVGFWEGAGGNPFSYILTPGGNGPIFSVYTPPASSLNPNQDVGSYFGWIGRAIGGTFNAIGGFISPAITPLIGLGNSFLSAIISGLSQGFQIFVTAFRLVLNFLGNQLGLGNLGDLVISLLSIVGTLITTGFSTIVSWFTTIGNLLTSGWLTFLAGAVGIIPALILFAISVWNFVFNAAFNIKTLLYMDGLICGMALYKKGLKGFFAWVSLNVFLLTFVFNAAWVVFDIITRPIHRTKETVDPVG